MRARLIGPRGCLVVLAIKTRAIKTRAITARAIWAAAIAAGAMAMGAPAARAEEPAFITFGATAFDWVEQKDLQVEYRLEYRGKKLLGPFKPVFALAGTFCPGGSSAFNFCPGDSLTGSGFLGGGVLLDFFFGRRIVISPSLTTHYYTGGTDDLDLGSPVVFRYQVETAYRFDNRSRIGVAFSRYDNFGLGARNPGAVSFTLYYSSPL